MRPVNMGEGRMWNTCYFFKIYLQRKNVQSVRGQIKRLRTVLFWVITRLAVLVTAKNPEESSSHTWTLRIGPIGCPETSVRNYNYSLRNNPEELSSQVLRGVSLKSRNNKIVPLTSLNKYFCSGKGEITNVCTLSSACYNTLTSLQDLASTYGIYGGHNYTETGFPPSSSVFPSVWNWAEGGGRCSEPKMTLEQISLRVLRFSPVTIIPLELHTLSFIFQRCSVMVTVGIIVK